MPLVYSVLTKGAPQLGENFETCSTANTEGDSMRIGAPGTRTVSLLSLLVMGKGAGLTVISGIAYRIKKWTSTASTGGAITPAPQDPGFQAAKCAAGAASPSSGGLLSGTGGPLLVGACGSGAAGPGGWVAENADAPPVIEASATQSIDVFVASGTISLKYEMAAKFQE